MHVHTHGKVCMQSCVYSDWIEVGWWMQGCVNV